MSWWAATIAKYRTATSTTATTRISGVTAGSSGRWASSTPRTRDTSETRLAAGAGAWSQRSMTATMPSQSRYPKACGDR